jgi:hypothetical protein
MPEHESKKDYVDVDTISNKKPSIQSKRYFKIALKVSRWIKKESYHEKDCIVGPNCNELNRVTGQ